MSGKAFPTVNSLVFTLAVVDRNEKVRTQLEKPITIELRQLSKANRSNPQCVHWTYGKRYHLFNLTYSSVELYLRWIKLFPVSYHMCLPEGSLAF